MLMLNIECTTIWYYVLFKLLEAIALYNNALSGDRIATNLEHYFYLTLKYLSQ